MDGATRIISGNHRECNEAENRDLLVKAMSSILGELLQTNPKQVSVERLEQWLDKSVIAPEKSFLGAGEIISGMCRNMTVWNRFLVKLEKAEKMIMKLRSNPPASRLFRDMQGTPYFWIYPEEIFPNPNEKNGDNKIEIRETP